MPVISNIIGTNSSNITNNFDSNINSGLVHEIIPDISILTSQKDNLDLTGLYSYALNDNMDTVYTLLSNEIIAYNLINDSEYIINLPDTDNTERSSIVWYNNELHWMGGQFSSSQGSINESHNVRHYVYNGSSWVKKNNLPQQSCYGSFTILNGTMYYVSTHQYDNGNGNASISQLYRPQVYGYTPSNDTWFQVGNLVEEHGGYFDGIQTYGKIHIYNDGKSLYVSLTRSITTIGEDKYTDVQFIYNPSSNKWIAWGGGCSNATYDTEIETFGMINGELYYINKSYIGKFVGAHMVKLNNFSDYSIDIPIAIKNECIFAVHNDQFRSRSIIKIKLTDFILCPKGSTIYTNDNDICKLNGHTFTEDTYVRVLHRSDIYFTVLLGNRVIYFKPDSKNHRAYCLKGTTINGQSIKTTGLTQLTNVDRVCVIS